ncbi:MAG: lipopolysaccharide biosynthesis protein [Caulobacteraceae bacterium]
MNTQHNPSGARTAIWIGVTGFGQVFKLLISMGSTIILAHLLVPGDFGLMATSGPIMGFVDLLRDAGFSQALVQRSDVSKEQGNGLFWMMMGITLVLGLLVMATAPLFAAAFHEPRLVGVLIVSALIMQVSSFGSQPMAWLNRHLRFHVLTIIDIASSALSLAAAAGVAYFTHSYWALVAAGVAGTFTSSGIALLVSGWRPGRPHFDRGVLQMARFGAGVSFSNIANYLSRNADNLLIAHRFGPVALGYYDRAYKLMLMPLTQITWPMARVMMPVLSRLQDKPKQYAETYLTTITLIMVAAQPALITATVLGRPVILLLLGAKWAPAIPIFQWLSAVAVHQVVSSSLGWLYLSQGRAKHYAVVGTFGSITTLAAFLIGLRWGAVGVAAAYTISDYALRFPFQWLYAGRTGPVRTKPLLNTLWPHLLGAATAIAGLLIYQHVVQPTGLVELALGVVLAYACYLPMLMVSGEKRDLLGKGVGHLVSRLTAFRESRQA